MKSGNTSITRATSEKDRWLPCHTWSESIASVASRLEYLRARRHNRARSWKNRNPDVPDWSRAAYNQALRDLAQIGLEELPHAVDQETVRSILGLLAIVHGARIYGRILVEFTEDEVLELEEQAFGVSEDAG
jgi:hypothetical protein